MSAELLTLLADCGIVCSLANDAHQQTLHYHDNRHCPRGGLNQAIVTDGSVHVIASSEELPPRGHFEGSGTCTVEVAGWTWIVVAAEDRSTNGSIHVAVSRVIVTPRADPTAVLGEVAAVLHGAGADADFLRIHDSRQARDWVAARYILSPSAPSGRADFHDRRLRRKCDTTPKPIQILTARFGRKVAQPPTAIPVTHTAQTRRMVPGSAQTIPEDLLDGGAGLMSRPDIRSYLTALAPELVELYASDWRSLISAIWPL